MKLNKIILISALILGTPAMCRQNPGDVNIKNDSDNPIQFKMINPHTQEIVAKTQGCIQPNGLDFLNLPASLGKTVSLEIHAYDCTTKQDHSSFLKFSEKTGVTGAQPPTTYTFDTSNYYSITCNPSSCTIEK